MPTAIVTGATGILGRAIVKELCKDPSTWTKVYTVSRSKKEDFGANCVHTNVDLTGSVDDIAKQMSGVTADYLFFAAYLEGKTEQEMCDVNGSMLRNFIKATKMGGSKGGVKRVLLVTGAKQYGVHFGPPKNPLEESDPWLYGPGRPPNFYYVQQDILKEESTQDGGAWDWTVTYPNDVIGVAKGNFMNLTTSLGLYCAVTKELGNDEVFWPGGEVFYTRMDTFTAATLHAQFCVWAVTASTASNQAFNVVNGDATSWQTMFPRVAKKFGLAVAKDQFNRPPPDQSFMELSDNPPIKDFEKEFGLEGKVSKVSVEQRVDLVRWSQRKDVKDAWNKLSEREGLEHDAFEKATWGFLGFAIGRPFDIVISMSKARAAGWTGYVDTWEALNEALQELEKEKVLPKAKQ